jgi:hypothetical protein
VKAAYEAVLIERDRVHVGTFTPNTRDRAEESRGALLSALLATSGLRARVELRHLAVEGVFSTREDRIRYLVRQHAARECEPSAFSPQDLRDLDKLLEPPALDRDGLFNIMCDRLEDIAHDIAHHDFTDRRTLRTISTEIEMQRTLALRFEHKANGAYVVTREDEVADRKETDIRLAATRGKNRAVIELKIADKRWSVADFEHALEHQLLAQYLRHANTLAGCFLLTYDGEKKRWEKADARGKRKLNFNQLIEHLALRAEELEQRENGRVRIKVFGIDLRDPELMPAQRR